jgi:hypothetical protein
MDALILLSPAVMIMLALPTLAVYILDVFLNLLIAAIRMNVPTIIATLQPDVFTFQLSVKMTMLVLEIFATLSLDANT